LTLDGSAGYSVVAQDNVVRFTIPNGTVIPARGHYLGVNSVNYSLSNYPAGNGTTAIGDTTFTTDIPDNNGVAIFNTATLGNFATATRLDAAGFTTSPTLFKEGTGLPTLIPISINYSFYRDNCGKSGSITTAGTCPSGGAVIDSDNNATDFIFADTLATSGVGAGQRLGAPGPENLSSPVQRNGAFGATLLDPGVSASSAPNRVRDLTPGPIATSMFGTLSIRRTIINNTAAPITRLRFRIVDITTFPAAGGYADLRAITSGTLLNVAITGPNPACPANLCTVQGTTLEVPPTQANGGGFNSTLSAGTITLAAPLAPGGMVNVQFLLGVQQTGTFRFYVNLEALP
jgi:hypothetical protein